VERSSAVLGSSANKIEEADLADIADNFALQLIVS
jgi:hypothetical protein